MTELRMVSVKLDVLSGLKGGAVQWQNMGQCRDFYIFWDMYENGHFSLINFLFILDKYNDILKSK